MKFSFASLLLRASLGSAAVSSGHWLHGDQRHLQESKAKGPIVDLSYERHQALINETGKYYNFSNVPYALPPIKERRFALPVEITETGNKLNDGSKGHICPQFQVGWVKEQLKFVQNYSDPRKSIDHWTDKERRADDEHIPHPDPRVNEDCLLLDVVVPQEIYDKHKGEKKVPVIIWIHGGGYIVGDKNQHGSPSGIFKQAVQGRDTTKEGVIWVQMNYRLGAFGFLTAPSFIEQGGVSNLGFYDQRLAIKWVYNNIHLFGGDPEQITVMGESAGASSIMHHLTAFGGEGEEHRPLFKRAIMQSPAFFPQTHNPEEESIYKGFLDLAKAADLKELRDASTEDLQYASAALIWQAPYGQFVFGPAVDDHFVPAPPSILLRDQRFWKDIEIMVSNNGHEGTLFAPPHIQNDTSFGEQIRKVLPSLSDQDVDEIIKRYPVPNAIPLQPKRNQVRRVAKFIAEMAVNCNTFYLLKAYAQQQTYKYIFDMYPAIHGQDTLYTFYRGPPQHGTGNVTYARVPLAAALQAHIAAFAKTGNPDDNKYYRVFPKYGSLRQLVLFTDGELGIGLPLKGVVRDTLSEENCEYWEGAPYYQPNGGASSEGDAHTGSWGDLK